MHSLREFSMRVTRHTALNGRNQYLTQKRNKVTSVRSFLSTTESEEDNKKWPRKIFSGIQPTGSLHVGNYLGAVRKWIDLQNNKEDVTYCIVDMHSITLPQEPALLRENTFRMAATLLACGVDPNLSTLFVQSAVCEHNELCWILSCLCTMARLGHLPQFKEKTRLVKDVPLGLYIYPVLQAADIMLYKATHIPVGEDQLQHIQLAQHLAKTFNSKFGGTFPICHAILENKEAARIRSLREPTKKMSKSDGDAKATINLMDEPEEIVEKIKKAVTDFSSDVKYSPESRLGVSNLIAIHSLITGRPVTKIVEEAKSIDTGKYKLRVADALIEHIKPIRNKVNNYLSNRNELIYLLDIGAEKARQTAEQTMIEVRRKVGLGAQHIPIIAVKDDSKIPELKGVVREFPKSIEKPVKEYKPEVPTQKMRIEKQRKEVKVEFKTITKNERESKTEPKIDLMDIPFNLKNETSATSTIMPPPPPPPPSSQLPPPQSTASILQAPYRKETPSAPAAFRKDMPIPQSAYKKEMPTIFKKETLTTAASTAFANKKDAVGTPSTLFNKKDTTSTMASAYKKETATSSSSINATATVSTTGTTAAHKKDAPPLVPKVSDSDVDKQTKEALV